MKLLALGLAVLTILVVTALLPIAIAQEVPAHVVISEVQVATNEFVELYNPTNSAINMTDWHWCYFPSTKTSWDDPSRDKAFPLGATIAPHGFYLVGLKGYPTSGGSPDSDWQAYTSSQLSNSAGTVGIFNGSPSDSTRVDAVGWGTAVHLTEGVNASVPAENKSIERKSLNGGYAPAQDTDDNSVDLSVQGTPTPKNSAAPAINPAPVELFDAAGNFKGRFTKIQDAVDRAIDGDTVLVHDGTYNENVDVNKRLTIRSEIGSALTIVNASNPNDHVFEVTANWVNISGFTVQNATKSTYPQTAGIYLGNGVEHCNISDNKATNNYFGICLWSSDNNNVTNNTCNSNDNSGIYLELSNSNTVSDNVCNQNTWEGIWLDQSNNNAIYNNAANLNNRGIDLEGQSNDNIITNNTCNSNNMLGISLLYRNPGNNNFFADNLVSDNNDYDFYSHEDADNNTVEDLTVASYPTTISFTYANGVGLKGVETAPGDPVGKANIGKFVNATDVTADSWIFLNVSYSDADLGGVDEDSLRMWRYNETDWTEVPAPNGVNTIENYVYANITEFSVFAPLGNVTGAKLEINKTSVPDPVSPGGTLNYTIHVNNTGNATATNVTVMETYDKNVTYVAAVPAPSQGTDTWQFATLNVSETRWINISVTVNASVLNGTVLHNIVNVTCDEGVTDSDAEDTTVLSAPEPALEINKTDNPDPVSPGGTLNYTISVNNTGNATATNVTAMETYDENVTFVTAVPAPSLGNDTWKFTSLNVSETRWINISVIVNVSVLNGTVLHNVINVTCDEGVSDTDTEETTVFAAPVLNCTCGDICVNGTGWWRDGGAFFAGGTPIQDAINNAIAGETICVKDGTYNENVDVNVNHLTIRSENGSTNCIVNASDSGDHVFCLTEDYVNISGFTVKGATGSKKAGIYLVDAEHCNILDNKATNNRYGLYLLGSCNNTLTNNIANSNNDHGFYLDSSSNNELTSNTANSNHYGIWLRASSNYNTLTNNNASDNEYGINLLRSHYNTITDNIANSNAYDGIWPSSYNTFINNTASKNKRHGIYLCRSKDNILRNNTANYNRDTGIFLTGRDVLYVCVNNMLENNTANSNGEYGIHLDDTCNNYLTGNTMSGNKYNFRVASSFTDLSVYTHNVDTSNKVEGKPIYFLVDKKDQQIPTDAGTVCVVNSTNITVRDLTLTNNGQGTLFAYTTNSRIENVSAPNNVYGIYVVDMSYNNTLRNNNANSNYAGICMRHSEYNTLTSNTANSNDHYGIYVLKGDNNVLLNNTLNSNGYYGIYLRETNKCTLTGNTANSNDYNGFYLYRSCTYNTLGNNTACENGRAGIYTSYMGNNYNNFTGNTANANDWYGISLEDSNHCTLTHNTALENRDGIALRSSSRNILTSNTANANTRYGIWLYSSSCKYNKITNNTMNSNSQYGVYLQSSSNNNITSNNVSNNTEYDFFSNRNSHNNAVKDLLISSYPTTISFTYDNGIKIKGVDTAPGDQPGKENVSKYVNARSVTADSWIFLNVSYSDADLGGVDEDSLRMWRYNGTDWTEVPAPNGVNTIKNYVYANITSFSIFAPLGNVTVANLEINKTGVPDPVSHGGTLNYSISVNNTGNANATNVIVTETYDGNVTFASAVPAASLGNNTWQFATLNVSETRWIKISVSVNASVLNGTVLHNSVNVSCDEGVMDTDTENTTVFVAPAQPPNITSSAPPSPVNDTVCNWRTFNVTVDQTVNVSWYLNSTLRRTNVSTKEANYTLHAEVVGEHNVSAMASNENGTDMQTWVWNVSAAPVPVLEINKTGVPDPVSPGGALSYTIAVNNAGNATATNVSVKETYDANVTFVSAVPAPSSGDDTWQFATLNVSETRRINISVTVNAAVPNGTVLHNIVNVSCDEGVTDTDTEDTTVPAIANVKISKWVKYKTEPESEYRKEIDDAKVCNNVSFKIAVQNNGTGTNLTGISVTDVLNCSLGYINDSANIPPTIYEDHCPNNQTFIWQFPGVWLEPCECINITFDAHVDECGNDTNYARVEAENETGYSVSDEDTVWVNCTEVPPVCVETATGSGIACFETDAGTIKDLVAVDESTLPAEGKPALVFPHGFFSFNITGLTPGQTVVVTITLPDNVPVGTQYWKYHASEGGWIQIRMGSDDGDNVITITLVDGGLGDDDGTANGVIVDQGGPGIPKPDLVITEKYETFVDGGSFNITYKVNNIGCADAGASNTTIYIDSVNVLEDPVPPLASGDSFTNTVGPFDCPCDATLNVTVCADNGNVVEESDETNNCEVNEVECPPCLPDLVITNIWTVGNEIHYTIRNKGCIPAPTSYSGLYIDGGYSARDRVDPLAPGDESDEEFARYSYRGGNIRACADYLDRIKEIDETNNCRGWTPAKKPDLVIEDKWEEWVSATHYIVTYVIHNNGTAIAPACHNTTLYVDGVAIEHKHVPVDLEPCETFTDTFDTVIECTGDSDTIRVCADNFNVVDELDETNNCLENECSCVKKPDLVITEKYETFVDGGDINITYKVNNIGGADAGPSNTTIYINGSIVLEVPTPGIPEGECHENTVGPFNCPCGETLNVAVCADNKDEVDESDERNNCEVNEVKCPPCLPDLVITDIWVDGNKIHYTIQNIGGEPAPRSLTGLWIDDIYRASEMDDPLAPGEESNGVFARYSYREGKIEVCADYSDRIEEIDETNNCRG